MLHSEVMKDQSDIADKEFTLIEEDEHIEEVFQEIQGHFDKYLTLYLKKIEENHSGNKREKILAHIKEIIDEYEKDRKPYEEFFERDKFFEEDSFDTSTFKSNLKKYCPVVRACCNSKSEVMKKWNAQFKLSKPDDLYDVFYNIIQFGDEYKETINHDEYASVRSWSELQFDQLNDKYHRLQGVIGSGIIATVLHALYPMYFPGHYRQGLFAIYFLTQHKTFNMPSETSEFIMVKDTEKGPNIMTLDHNFFFPISVYTLYALKIYRLIEKRFLDLDIQFPQDYRYVLTGDFFKFILFEVHDTDVQTLVGSDDLEKYGRLYRL